MTISADKIIHRSVLLIALQRQGKIKKNVLDKILPDWKSVLKYLCDIDIDIKENNDYLELQTPVAFDLYQSIPSEIFNDVTKLIWQIIPRPKIVESSTISHKILEPNFIDNSRNSFPCINCADPPCMTYTFDLFGSVDKFPNRVCPDDLINLDKSGFIEINDSACTGCSLCLIRCPFNSIQLEKGNIKIQKYSTREIGTIVKEKIIQLDEKREITNKILGQISKKSKDVLFKNNTCEILDNFDNKVAQENWNRDKYYIFIRNLFRELGLVASYTGAGGKLRRSDVTIVSPFLVGIEVKSPAESDVSVGAVRQAMDARLEVSNTHQHPLNDTFCAAIAQGIARGAHRRAIANKAYDVMIPIITGRILLYILLKHTTNLPQDAKHDLKLLFTNYAGHVNHDVLKNYFENYFNRRIKEIKKDLISLPIPPQINLSNKEQAIKQLEYLKDNISNEIDSCFKPTSRNARGNYST